MLESSLRGEYMSTVSYSTMQIIKKESANLVCGFRFFGSFWLIFWLVLFNPPLLLTAVFYTILFMSDALDRYLYRKYVKNNPPKHWFNKMSIDINPIANITLSVAGFIYVIVCGFHNFPLIILLATLVEVWTGTFLFWQKEIKEKEFYLYYPLRDKFNIILLRFSWMVWIWILAVGPVNLRGFIIATTILHIYYFLLIVNEKSRKN